MIKKKFILSLNTGMFVNRFTNYEKFSNFLKNYLKIENIQLTSDFLMLNMDNKNVYKHADKIQKSLNKNKITINSTFTGAFTRLNHLSHPDKDHQNFWINWFKRFFKISKEMGAKYSGSHLGIIGMDEQAKLNNILIKRLVNNWNKLSEYAYKINLKGLIWEPMSIKREFGNTIKSTKKINRLLNVKSKVPIFNCLDIAHGDETSKRNVDRDPYSWLTSFADNSPVIHLKQKVKNNFGHLSFINKNNKIGIVKSDKVIRYLNKSKLSEHELVLELSFKERSSVENRLKKDILNSVTYWKKSLI